MIINLENLPENKVKKITKDITRSNIIVSALYQLLENYFELRSNDSNIEKNKEVIQEIDKIINVVMEINHRRILAKNTSNNIIILNFIEESKRSSISFDGLTNYGNLQTLIKQSGYYKSVIEDWIFCLELIGNEIYTDEIYEGLYNNSLKLKYDSNTDQLFEIKEHFKKINSKKITVKISTNISLNNKSRKKVAANKISLLKANYANLA